MQEIGLNAAQRQFIADHGITTVASLKDFKEDDFKELVKESRKMVTLPQVLPANAPPDAQPGLVQQIGCKMPMNSPTKLHIAASAIRFYQAIGVEPTPGLLNYDNILVNLHAVLTVLHENRKNTEDWPKVKGNKIMEFLEQFDARCKEQSSKRLDAPGPLSYVIRAEAIVPAAAPPRAPGQAYSVVHGSIADELAARLSHEHPMFSTDNKAVFAKLELGLIGSAYSAALQPYKRMTDGRGAYIAIKTQFAGQDVCQVVFNEQERSINTGDFTGTNPNFPLSKLLEKHRSAYAKMQQMGPYIDPPPQIMNEHTRVIKFLERIKCPDAALQAAIAHIRDDKTPDTGKYNSFEAMAAYIGLSCPVQRNGGVGKKRTNANISGIGVVDEEGDSQHYAAISDLSVASSKNKNKSSHVRFHVSEASGTIDKQHLKFGIGKSGVHFRYHKGAEYKALTPPQKAELHQYRKELRQKNLPLPGEPATDKSDRFSKKKKGFGGKGFGGKKKTAAKALAISMLEAEIEKSAKEDAQLEAIADKLKAKGVNLNTRKAAAAGAVLNDDDRPELASLTALLGRIKSQPM